MKIKINNKMGFLIILYCVCASSFNVLPTIVEECTDQIEEIENAAGINIATACMSKSDHKSTNKDENSSTTQIRDINDSIKHGETKDYSLNLNNEKENSNYNDITNRHKITRYSPKIKKHIFKERKLYNSGTDNYMSMSKIREIKEQNLTTSSNDSSNLGEKITNDDQYFKPILKCFESANENMSANNYRKCDNDIENKYEEILYKNEDEIYEDMVFKEDPYNKNIGSVHDISNENLKVKINVEEINQHENYYLEKKIIFTLEPTVYDFSYSFFTQKKGIYQFSDIAKDKKNVYVIYDSYSINNFIDNNYSNTRFFRRTVSIFFKDSESADKMLESKKYLHLKEEISENEIVSNSNNEFKEKFSFQEEFRLEYEKNNIGLPKGTDNIIFSVNLVYEEKIEIFDSLDSTNNRIERFMEKYSIGKVHYNNKDINHMNKDDRSNEFKAKILFRDKFFIDKSTVLNYLKFKNEQYNPHIYVNIHNVEQDYNPFWIMKTKNKNYPIKSNIKNFKNKINYIELKFEEKSKKNFNSDRDLHTKPIFLSNDLKVSVILLKSNEKEKIIPFFNSVCDLFDMICFLNIDMISGEFLFQIKDHSFNFKITLKFESSNKELLDRFGFINYNLKVNDILKIQKICDEHIQHEDQLNTRSKDFNRKNRIIGEVYEIKNIIEQKNDNISTLCNNKKSNMNFENPRERTISGDSSFVDESNDVMDNHEDEKEKKEDTGSDDIIRENKYTREASSDSTEKEKKNIAEESIFQIFCRNLQEFYTNSVKKIFKRSQANIVKNDQSLILQKEEDLNPQKDKKLLKSKPKKILNRLKSQDSGYDTYSYRTSRSSSFNRSVKSSIYKPDNFELETTEEIFNTNDLTAIQNSIDPDTEVESKDWEDTVLNLNPKIFKIKTELKKEKETSNPEVLNYKNSYDNEIYMQNQDFLPSKSENTGDSDTKKFYKMQNRTRRYKFVFDKKTEKLDVNKQKDVDKKTEKCWLGKDKYKLIEEKFLKRLKENKKDILRILKDFSSQYILKFEDTNIDEFDNFAINIEEIYFNLEQSEEFSIQFELKKNK